VVGVISAGRHKGVLPDVQRDNRNMLISSIHRRTHFHFRSREMAILSPCV
jgi:hypothetical protein